MKSPSRRIRVMIGGVECICRCPVHDNNEFVDNSSQTHSKHVSFASIDRVDRTNRLTYKRRNTSSFSPYIRRLVHTSAATKDLSISQQAIHELNELLHSVMDQLSTEAGKLSRRVNQKTLLPKDIQAASKLTFPPLKYEKANMYALQALFKFKQTN